MCKRPGRSIFRICMVWIHGSVLQSICGVFENVRRNKYFGVKAVSRIEMEARVKTFEKDSRNCIYKVAGEMMRSRY